MLQKVLLVEDSTSLAILYKQYVKSEPYEFFHVTTGEDAKNFIVKNPPQLIILDLKLPDISGKEILQWIRDQKIPTAVIIATAHGTIDIAVTLIQNGANDFLEKPIQADRLKTSIKNHLKNNKLEMLVEDIQNTFNYKKYQGFIGSSLPMQAVYKIIDAVAPTNANVFISGESGTGKEVCAEAIHYKSQRYNKPFVAINCGAIPRDLMESEIFGHVKGAFTGATTDRKGAAMLANGGTLFLDELCEMELEMQKKLLRFLQTGRFTPLGGSKEVSTDLRIICATNRDPLLELNEKRFREDLYYRVNVVPIKMPPLRDRDTDIIDIARFFLKKYAKEDNKKFRAIKRNVELKLCHYSWPGNVRQLQNIIRNIVVLHNDTHVLMEHLPEPLNKLTSSTKTPEKPQEKQNNVTPIKPPANIDPPLHTVATSNTENDDKKTINTNLIRPMADIEREVIENAIDYCEGNVLNAAVLLELSPSTLYRKKQIWDTYEESD
ncbi:sigma-54-dependent Fis family transcriptional regulator [Photobacterium kishitanii]|uniref:Sigma-54-dependent Fis family transcriptional regulator n=1 Tax=Photobacterium kishitanii TaxID=318456 RepID=A0A2T3KFK4_9GAMM|nr:sigma-54 dependent transcriptional regulator [Photobacterium kishitanii]PSU92084.1 sigma-54-dependent Fis family transcriptional regulator [Photobacterium kishitanii]PSU96818.1 sigma-54-dependent Fis family transcriptional regulator [Photobacterium kishitanii]PSU96922.1 sigma-54-dependent Fis family transcriptional regulator [Photobacterium kishitanii]PSW69340.1 sigma-54-dependent Fis family transcriptional regulator [Photobacterium kishitanii]